MLRKKNTVLAIVSVMVLGLLVTGVVGLAGGNGRGNGAGDGTGTDSSLERDSDNDDILNHNDDDYTSPEDGGGYGALGSFLESFFGFLF
ncbi:hypothetical protein AKJ52_01660 [candidate division MSBL1 archaeon SCGC-AAA382C18]|uniref:Uncharacterized protein n=1 Tax=candidate division MSBL1 archaeon SCGC-AAA382C18 TaxID=1698281 RepID=A0A133VJZ2_9EURY|nr:hypothetical protein AKJ52_01660 [candidate division MSBL1 archaeon SCGC-AAA382C18]